MIDVQSYAREHGPECGASPEEVHLYRPLEVGVPVGLCIGCKKTLRHGPPKDHATCKGCFKARRECPASESLYDTDVFVPDDRGLSRQGEKLHGWGRR